MDVAIATTHFNAITPGNSMKPDTLQRTEGQFNFTDGDRLVQIAEQSGATPIGHVLVWHEQTPRWFFEGPDGRPAGRELALARLRKHITTVVGHYKGRVKQWDVVNEAISDTPGEKLRQTPWLKAIGEDYIAEAFRAAHAADPKALLIYNDYNIELGYKRPKALQLLRSLLDQKVPIHAVGIQGHWRMDNPDYAEDEESIKQFAALGLKVMITELDIGVLPTQYQGANISVRETMTPEMQATMNPYTVSLPDAVARQHAERYRQAFAMFLRHKDVIGRVTLWGPHDGDSWFNDFPIKGRTDYPLLFDRQGKPKPAFYAVQQAAQAFSAQSSINPPAAVQASTGATNDGSKVPVSILAPPMRITTEQDHQRMMRLLGITSLRPGPSGDPNAPNAANTDESKANPYPNLPDPLALKDRRKVTTAEMWWNVRRSEIVEDFNREIYGRVPENLPQVKWEVTGTLREMNGAVPVVTKQLVGHVDNSAYPLIKVDIQLTLTTPANATGSVPVMMTFGFGRRPAGAPGGGTSGRSEPTWQQQVLAKGWGYAVLVPTSYQVDNGAGLTQGIIGLLNKGQPRKVDDWGALRAWAWGASRALDYFETDKSVDARQVGIEGLSRYGKAALVTMAYEPRFAIGFIGSSGQGGAKLHRRNFGELVENVASSGEYHWMAGNYIKYAGPLNWNDLPVDSHQLIALCAPRPVFISNGSPNVEGNWIDSRGQFLATVAAGPVYRLLGKKDLGTTVMPAIESALIGGDLAFRQHSGGHTTGPNWPTFLIYASRYIKGSSVEATQMRANAP
jgi:GH35 family endo-1,4-beta-xylanase